MSEQRRTERPMSQADVARLAATLIEAIERGDVDATNEELAFLRSLADSPAGTRP